MKNYKKVISVVLGLLLAFNVVGCSNTKDTTSTKNDSKEFDAYIEKLPTKLLGDNDMNLEFTFENPSNYGFEEELLELPCSDEEDYKESKKESDKILKELKGAYACQQLGGHVIWVDAEQSWMNSWAETLSLIHIFPIIDG